MAKKIKMLKPGKHVASTGHTYEFSEADLAATAKAYNPELHAAPMVIGHPRHDAPAYGRITAIQFADGFLLGEPSKVDPAFAESVNSGHFDRVSLSLYSPDSPSNPVPGVWYPRHLGFLGAMPPGVKGLGAAQFAEGEKGIVEFGDWNDRLIARLFRNIKNHLIGTVGQEQADKVLDEWDLQAITEEALRPELPAEPVNPGFAEPAREEPGMTPEELAAREADLKKREQLLNARAATSAHTANVSFCEGLVKEGKLLPAMKGQVVAILDFAEGLEENNTIEFGEGDAKKTAPVAETLRGLLSSYPKIIEFAELGAGEIPAGGDGKTIPADLTKHV